MSRPRLVARLHDCVHHKLTLICAPAGAGKTTLLRDFVDETDVATAWCQVDRSSADPTVLAESLLWSLGVQPNPIERGEDSSQALRMRQALLRLVHALSQAAESRGGSLVLVVDDYHRVDGSNAVNEMMAELLELVTPDVHLVISSRSAPALPLARMRLNGDLLELGQEDLVLDSDELSAFLTGSGGPRLSEDEINLILDKTGGWIAGVSMLTQSVHSRGKGEIITFLRDFSGSSELVYDYFAEEVLRQQPPSIQHFLMATSLLDVLHRDLVNSLLGIDDAQSILESLTANNVFIMCLDHNHDWYRYHLLFREFLRARANRSLSQAEITALHHRAAEVHASKGNWTGAIDHLCAAASFEEAAAVIERVGETYLENGYMETVAQWLSRLPDPLKCERPSLLLKEGVIAQRQGRYQEAARALTRAQALFAEVGDANALVSVAAERAMVSYRLRNFREAVDLLECTLAAVSDTPRRAQTLARLCLSYNELGELERAERVGEAALRTLRSDDSSPHPWLECRTLRYLAETCVLRGDLDRALSLLLRAKDFYNGDREQFADLELANITCDLGIIWALGGEAERALQTFDEAQAPGMNRERLEQQRVWQPRAFLWRANVLTDLGDFDSAERYYQMAGFPAAERGWLHIRRHEPGRAILIARKALEEATGNEPLKNASLTAVLGLALGASGQESNALKFLQQAEAVLEAHGYTHHLTSLRLHLARLLIGGKQVDLGIRTLRETLLVCESHGFLHFYWWDPESLAGLLKHALSEKQDRQFVERLVERHPGDADRQALAPLIAKPADDGPSAVSDLVQSLDDTTQLLSRALASCSDMAARARIESAIVADPHAAKCVLKLHADFAFTWREIEVFVAYYVERHPWSTEEARIFRRGLADRLCMTENTLKSHVRRIRRKLDLPERADSLQVYRTIVATGTDASL